MWALRRFEDDEVEDFPWAEVFCHPRLTRVTSLPHAAAQALRDLGHPSPVKSGKPPKRKRLSASPQPTPPKRKPKHEAETPARRRGSQQAASGAVGASADFAFASPLQPKSRRKASAAAPSGGKSAATPAASPGSQRRGRQKKGATPMSLTSKKRRLETAAVAASPASCDGDASDHSCLPQFDRGGAGGDADGGGASDSDREFAARRRAVNAGKRTKVTDAAAEEAAEECARRAAGGGPSWNKLCDTGAACLISQLGPCFSEFFLQLAVCQRAGIPGLCRSRLFSMVSTA